MRLLPFAPAGIYPEDRFRAGCEILQKRDLQVHPITPVNAHFRYAGTDEQRFIELATVLKQEAEVAWAIRGGYGVVRLLSRLDNADRSVFHPKWVVGFSDLTALHCWIHARLGWPTLHATMLNGLEQATPQSIDSALILLTDTSNAFTITQVADPANVPGLASGNIVGGNLSVLHGLCGSPWMPTGGGQILFLEDLNEPWYKVDRMLWTLKHSGLLAKLSGLIVGDFSEMPDNDTGMSLQELVLEKVAEYGYPVWFGFPAGHTDNNVAIRMNAPVALKVTTEGECELQYLPVTFP
jgi:muramoyltetrapeptide carboxypeptidase